MQPVACRIPHVAKVVRLFVSFTCTGTSVLLIHSHVKNHFDVGLAILLCSTGHTAVQPGQEEIEIAVLSGEKS